MREMNIKEEIIKVVAKYFDIGDENTTPTDLEKKMIGELETADLDKAIILSEVESKFRIIISNDDAEKLFTINQLIEYVENLTYTGKN